MAKETLTQKEIDETAEEVRDTLLDEYLQATMDLLIERQTNPRPMWVRPEGTTTTDTSDVAYLEELLG